MRPLYIASWDAYAGKTAVALGLALNFSDEGLRVGYMKPIGTSPTTVHGQPTDEDVAFVYQVLGSSDPMELGSPVLLTSEQLRQPLTGAKPPETLRKAVQTSAKMLTKNRDVLILEGTTGVAQGRALHLSAPDVAELTNSWVVAVLKYHLLHPLDEILLMQDLFKGRLRGVILNQVPRHAVDEIEEELGSFLGRHNLLLYGALLTDPILTAVTVRELVEVLEGEVLTSHNHMDDLVETFMIGAMSVDSALAHFQRKENKAVITGGDRTDIQLAALETSTRCLVLTGNMYPSPAALREASDREVPVILVPHDTMTTVDKVERVMGRIRLGSTHQIARLRHITQRDVDLEALLRLVREP